MTHPRRGRIVRDMNEELDFLHGKIVQLSDLCRQLRQENGQLRLQLAEREQYNRELKNKLDETRARIENLITRLPEDM